MGRRSVVTLGLVVLTGCTGGSGRGAPSPDSAAVVAARAAASALGVDLVGMLTRELEAGGPAAAIAVCADSAQVRTARHRAEGGYLRRVGTRVRNPANAPDSVERAVLDAFVAAKAAGRQPADTYFVAAGTDGRPYLHFMRPVLIGPPCLACHGDPAEMSPSVRAVIATRYPGDQATGYRLGEVRGAVSVRVPR
jgi:hypothetical protein